MLPWMTFLNASLLFGAAAFSVPLIIHLLNRSRFKSVDWGAMLFLDEALQANSRRIEWQKWLLLLLRCCIPIFLALCMARPLLQSGVLSASLPGGQTEATYLLFDNSLSMATKNDLQASPPESALDQAKHFALEMIESAARNSRWGLGTLTSSPDEASEITPRDIQRQREQLDAIQPIVGNSNLLASFDKAFAELAKSSESHRQIIVLSDFQKSMCQSIETTHAESFRRRLDELPNPPSIFLLPIGNPNTTKSEPHNVTIRIDSQTRSVVGVGQPWEVRLIVTNFGKSTAQNIKLILSVDGTPTSSKTVEIPGQAETQIAFGMAFTEEGSHRVDATIEIVEGLTADNQATWSVIALQSIPVLIVDPTLKDRKKGPESDFLQAALVPFADSLDEQGNLFQVSRLVPDDLTQERIGEFKIVVLANVPKLANAIVSPLMEHVHRGGILMVFAGDRIEPAWYNRTLASTPVHSDANALLASEQPFLPFLYDNEPQVIQGNADRMKLLRENFQHPTTVFLNDARSVNFDNLEVDRWYRFLPNSNPSNKSVEQLISLTNGDGFLAARSFGDGTVLQCSTTCSDRWTNWPLRPIYLPMIHQFLLNATPPVRWPINVETGQQLNFPTSQLLSWIETPKPSNTPIDKSSSKSGHAISNRESQTSLSAQVWTLPNSIQIESPSIIAQIPGIYSIEGIADRPLYLSAQAPLGESNLELEYENGLLSLADRMGARIIRSADEIKALDNRGHQEIWRWFLIGLLGLLFGELFLERRLTGVVG
ncbi:MAG: BatA domain-containing protein [Pirellulaceae bacterium]|nr:BatA domain-containing protein [Pirellulaceae bacterium]